MKIFLLRKRILLSFLLLALSFLFQSSCQFNRAKSKLGPEDADFLSNVRYIIISKERKIFLEIPEEERARFKEDFWRRRDPDPETEENEFKLTYFSRIEEANRLFSTGRPGWLTDRGEVYVLFGPPTNIDRYPMGQGPGSRPTEVWYYGYFPIVFIDYHGAGDYTRQEDDVIHMHEVNIALEAARMTLRHDVALYDFSVRFKKDGEKQLIVVKIPYKNLWLKSTPEGGETVLNLSLEVTDSHDQVIWNFKKDFLIRLSNEEFEKKKNKAFVVRMPVEFNKGKYIVNAILINRTGDSESKRTLAIEI